MIWNYHDSILFGAEKKKTRLPDKYTVEMKSFLDNYKKEHSDAKKKGNVEKNESDPFRHLFFASFVFGF